MPSAMPMAMDVAAMPMRPGRSWSAQDSVHAGVVPPVRVLLIHWSGDRRALRPFCSPAERQHVRSEPDAAGDLPSTPPPRRGDVDQPDERAPHRRGSSLSTVSGEGVSQHRCLLAWLR